MKTEINLEGDILNSMLSYCDSRFKHQLRVIQDNIEDRLIHKDKTHIHKVKEVRDIAVRFAALYLSTNKKVKSLIGNSKDDQDLSNLISCYVAANALIQINQTEAPDNQTIEKKILKLKVPIISGLDLGKSDFVVIDNVLKLYDNYMTDHVSFNDVKDTANNFFNYLSEVYLTSTAKTPVFRDNITFLEDLVVTGPNFSIKGIVQLKKQEQKKKTAQNTNGDDQFRKDFERFELTNESKVYPGHIVGNDKAVSKIHKAIYKLMAYRLEDGVNPYVYNGKKRGFTQGFLLHGDTGTGKTMLAKYGMTLADKISGETGKKVEFVKFNIESGYQEGGSQMLQYQLNKISAGKEIYIVFIDELDTVFDSRSNNSNNSMYHRQKLGHMLRFIDGGYPNRGNYMIFGTCNEMKFVDKALSNARLERIQVLGPKSPEDMVKVLALNFGPDLKNGLVQVDDWGRIGQFCYKSGFNGRQLAEISSKCYEVSENISDELADKIAIAPSLDIAMKLIGNSYRPITESLILHAASEESRKDMEEQLSSYKFSQGK